MRLSKRQLKRIIREEYSKLKRRGLIREMNHDTDIQVHDFDRSDPVACAEYDDAFEELEADYEEHLANQEPASYDGYGRSSDYFYEEPYYDPSWGDSPKDYID